MLVSAQVLSDFAEKFRDLELLVDGKGDETSRSRPSRRSNVFSLKVPLANPERLLEWLYPRLRFCFSASFVCLVGATFLPALVLAILHWEELAFGLAEAVSLQGLVFVLVTVSGVTILHELAHART